MYATGISALCPDLIIKEFPYGPKNFMKYAPVLIHSTKPPSKAPTQDTRQEEEPSAGPQSPPEEFLKSRQNHPVCHKRPNKENYAGAIPVKEYLA